VVDNDIKNIVFINIIEQTSFGHVLNLLNQRIYTDEKNILTNLDYYVTDCAGSAAYRQHRTVPVSCHSGNSCGSIGQWL
jgi:hypothetical protein